MSNLEKLDKTINTNSDVLIVEDNKFNRYVIISFLKNMELTYDIAVNGKDGVYMTSNNMYRIILMDMHMPIMNGVDAIKEIVKKSHPPIIVMTANVYNFDKENCRELGATSFISKPIDFDKFKKKINKYILSKEIIDLKKITTV